MKEAENIGNSQKDSLGEPSKHMIHSAMPADNQKKRPLTVQRERLPTTRQSVTHKVTIAGTTKLYFTVGKYPDGRPGELFILIDHEGSELGGAYDAWGIAVSMLLQSGWTLADLEKKFAFIRCEPSGMTTNPDIPIAQSPVDYIIRWMTKHFSNGEKAGND